MAIYVKNLSLSFELEKPSSFSKQILKYRVFHPVCEACLTIILQQITARRNVDLINQMMIFREELIKTFPPTKKLFDKFKRKCLRNILVFTIIFTASMYAGFSVYMQQTLLGFVIFVIYFIPIYVIASSGCYVYGIIQFLICVQKSLILLAEELGNRFCDSDSVQDILMMWHSMLYSIKEHFSLKFCFFVLGLIFYWMNQFVYQVLK